MKKNNPQWRDPKQERTDAMHKIEIRESLRQPYANRFSSKNEPQTRRMNPKKLRKIKNLYKKAVILSNEIQERKRK
jgi:hypothetical protein